MKFIVHVAGVVDGLKDERTVRWKVELMLKQTDRQWVLPSLRKALPQSRTEATMSFCRFVESTEAESRQANRIAGFLSMHSLALAKQNEFPSQQLSAPSKLNVKRRNR